MRTQTAKLILSLFVAFLTVNVSAQDFGDHSSSTLTTKAWKALESGESDMALKYVDKCVELYMAQAVKMQASLSALADVDSASTYWALNDVGTCLFIKGQILAKKDNKKGAIVIFKELTTKLKYAQCWDQNGWFWQPAEAAKQKIVELSYEEE
ncbi:MAG: hypothetical protein NE330_09255 [Lentisphaeraceae bacterium]|nr:hypothetical protein [Lentisphaeraceae bacterium]